MIINNKKNKTNKNIIEDMKVLAGLYSGLLKFKKYTKCGIVEHIEIPCAVTKEDSVVIRINETLKKQKRF